MQNSTNFFSNRDCEHFPCHSNADREQFNCLFCYCPLYFLPNCPGDCIITEKGIKNCKNCAFPHAPKNYATIISWLKAAKHCRKTSHAASGKDVCILSCSPHKDGNCDHAAFLAGDAVRSMQASAEILFLRDFRIIPCNACGYCDRYTGQCIIDPADDAEELFEKIHSAKVLLLVAPVWFYGVPAQLKCLIDRTQKFWHDTTMAKAALRPAMVILNAGRKKGKQLFNPSLLVLHQFFRMLRRKLVPEPLCIRGTDSMDVSGRDARICAIREFGLRAAELATDTPEQKKLLEEK